MADEQDAVADAEIRISRDAHFNKIRDSIRKNAAEGILDMDGVIASIELLKARCMVDITNHIEDANHKFGIIFDSMVRSGKL